MFLSLSISQLDIISVRYDCDYCGDGGPGFYGFPFKYRTTIPWVNSMSGDFYISGFLGNTLFFFVIIFALIILLKRIVKSLKVKKIFKIIGYVLTTILLLLAAMNFFIIDWRFEWKDTYYNNYGGKPLKCEKHLEFFSTGKN